MQADPNRRIAVFTLAAAAALAACAAPVAADPSGPVAAPAGGTMPGLQAEPPRVPSSTRLTAQPSDDDFPAAAAAPDGRVWVAYVAYRRGPALDARAIHEERTFDALVPEGNGDQLRLVGFDGGAWSAPIPVTGAGLDLWRPAVAVGGRGTVWVIWSQNVRGNWDLFARGHDPGSGEWGEVRRLTEDPGADVYAVAATDPRNGAVWVAWQGWRGDDFDIFLASLEGGRRGRARRLSSSPADEWCPAMAFDAKGVLYVAFDTYARGDYDVKLIADAAGRNPRSIDIAASPRFEARPSVAADAAGRIWVAYEEGDPNWGKDFGMRWFGTRGAQLYHRREIVLRCLEGDRVRQARGAVPAEPIKRTYPPGKARRMSHPRLVVDGAGRVWLLYRRHPRSGGGGEAWASYVTYHAGEAWAPPVALPHSANILDNRPAVLPRPGGGVLAVHSTDGRTRNTQSAKQNDLYGSVVEGPGGAKVPSLRPLPAREAVAPVHPAEPEDVRRIRSWRATIGGKTYRLLRGEFHRHTELTSHRDQDGSLEDMWRYGLDAARMDWIGNGDHDNGYGQEYLWWLVQKQTDIFHHPPYFLPMFTYERSVTYPSGHRNAMFARRGIRPLPRIPGGRDRLYGTPEKGSPDIATFYAYLKHFRGICASHTSGTNMGTDWRDNDPEAEPVVEIYQGLRQSYEHEGAPATARNAKDSIGGYRPAGFVWNALRKGYRLGFEVSSDHYSTHISYAVVYAEEASREAILDAFRRRHCYGANDNIILDVRCGEHMMGDAFELRGKPKLEITAIGTRPIAQVDIIRGVGRDTPRYVHTAEPGEREVRLTWTDASPRVGETSFYYVRIEQERPEGGPGALAWASPLWITVRP